MEMDTRPPCICFAGSLRTRSIMQRESLAISNEHRINLYALYSRFGHGYALAKLGDPEPALLGLQLIFRPMRHNQKNSFLLDLAQHKL